MINLTKTLYFFFIGAGLCFNAESAVVKTVWPDAPLKNFIFIENLEDNNLFVAPTDGLDPRLTGANTWTSLKGIGQASLAYVDNGYNANITNWNVDMWENGPISHPYANQRCIMTYNGCDPETSESINKPTFVDRQGFYGLMDPAVGWGHGKLSPSFFDYLRTMPVGGILNREMNLCITTAVYDANSGGRCKEQTTGYWYVRNMQHKKAGHLRFTQTNAFSEVIVDSNGIPYVLPGSKGCENYRLGRSDGVVCRFLDYNFDEDGSQTYNEPYMYTNLKNSSLNSAIVNADIQMSSDRVNWSQKGGRYNISNLRGQNSIYLFLSSNFFKQVVRLGLQEQLTRNLINFNMKNGYSPESGYYEFSGTTEIQIKSREFSVSILSSDGVSNPYREGEVGKDKLSFLYNIAESGPASADKLDIWLTQDAGNPYQSFCTFYPLGNIEPSKAVPVPTNLVFDSILHGSEYKQPIGCDSTPVDIRALGIKDKQPQQEWTNSNGDPGITRFYSLALEFDLTDPMVSNTTTNKIWEGEVNQSGTIIIKGYWN